MTTTYFGLTIPFAEHCAIEPVSMGGGRSCFRLVMTRSHENSLGMAHGGVLLTLLDMALASAARSTLDEGSTVMTVDMQTMFLAPARGTLEAHGHVVKSGRSVLFSEGEVRDSAGEVCARATAVFRRTAKRAETSGGDA